MLTEDEALNKRCCGSEGCGEVPRPSLKDGRHCIGSKCMAWVWGNAAEERSGSHHRDQELQRSGYKFLRAEGNDKFFELKDRRGYCGLTSH